MGLGSLLGNFVLLLTTTGRKTGKLRVAPLQYEEIDDNIYVASARGMNSDWVKNILANPSVIVRIKSRRISTNAIVITDQKQITDFLQIRYQRHPKMIGKILKSEGVSIPPSLTDLEKHARNLVLVEIIPD